MTTATALAAPDPTDLLRAVAAGRPGAWADLERRYQPMLRARTRRFRLQEADALDAVQTTWMRLAENLDRIHTPEHLAGWLATTVSRECLRIVRGGSRVVCDDDMVQAVADVAPGVDEQVVDDVLADADREALRDALDVLSPRRRALIVALFADDRRPYVEIARACGLPVGSVGPTRARTLAQLRAILRDRAGMVTRSG